MKAYLIIILVTFWCISSAQMDWSVKENFRGPIKSVSTYSYSFGWRVQIPQPDTFTNFTEIEIIAIIFDKEKRPVKSIRLNKENDTTAHCIWEYDKYGRLLKQIDYREKNSLEQTLEYSYEKKGITIEKLFLPKKGLYTTWITEIDSIDFKSRYTLLFKGKVNHRYYNILNDSFLPLSGFEIDSNGHSFKINENKYDNNNRKLSYIGYRIDSTIYKHFEYRYDKQGNKIEIKEFDNTGQVTKLVNQHFDSLGNPVRILTFYPNQENNYTFIDRIDYTYDKYGNWISKKTYSEFEKLIDSLTEKVYRQIEYF